MLLKRGFSEFQNMFSGFPCNFRVDLMIFSYSWKSQFLAKSNPGKGLEIIEN